MRKEHKNPKGGLTAAGRAYFKRTEGSNLKAPVKGGLNPRRISFAARFGGMKGAMKDSKNRPTRLALALKAWGFRNKESARAFAARHKKSWKEKRKTVYFVVGSALFAIKNCCQTWVVGLLMLNTGGFVMQVMVIALIDITRIT